MRVDLTALERLLATPPYEVDAAYKYQPCLEIMDAPALVARHLRACVAHLRRLRPELTAAQALAMERAKIGYFAGAAPHPVRQQIELAYHCVHPFAGPASDHHPRRAIQLASKFADMVRCWDTQPPGSRAFGMFAQPDYGLDSYAIKAVD